jgi:hypothetical protein
MTDSCHFDPPEWLTKYARERGIELSETIACSNCKRPATRTCSDCGAAFYCDDDACVDAFWVARHGNECEALGKLAKRILSEASSGLVGADVDMADAAVADASATLADDDPVLAFDFATVGDIKAKEAVVKRNPKSDDEESDRGSESGSESAASSSRSMSSFKGSESAFESESDAPANDEATAATAAAAAPMVALVEIIKTRAPIDARAVALLELLMVGNSTPKPGDALPAGQSVVTTQTLDSDTPHYAEECLPIVLTLPLLPEPRAPSDSLPAAAEPVKLPLGRFYVSIAEGEEAESGSAFDIHMKPAKAIRGQRGGKTVAGNVIARIFKTDGSGGAMQTEIEAYDGSVAALGGRGSELLPRFVRSIEALLRPEGYSDAHPNLTGRSDYFDEATGVLRPEAQAVPKCRTLFDATNGLCGCCFACGRVLKSSEDKKRRACKNHEESVALLLQSMLSKQLEKKNADVFLGQPAMALRHLVPNLTLLADVMPRMQDAVAAAEAAAAAASDAGRDGKKKDRKGEKKHKHRSKDGDGEKKEHKDKHRHHHRENETEEERKKRKEAKAARKAAKAAKKAAEKEAKSKEAEKREARNAARRARAKKKAEEDKKKQHQQNEASDSGVPKAPVVPEAEKTLDEPVGFRSEEREAEKSDAPRPPIAIPAADVALDQGSAPGALASNPTATAAAAAAKPNEPEPMQVDGRGAERVASPPPPPLIAKAPSASTSASGPAPAIQVATASVEPPQQTQETSAFRRAAAFAALSAPPFDPRKCALAMIAEQNATPIKHIPVAITWSSRDGTKFSFELRFSDGRAIATAVRCGDAWRMYEIAPEKLTVMAMETLDEIPIDVWCVASN